MTVCRNNSVSPINQVLCSLRYFSSSEHLIQTADFMHICINSIKKVSQAIARLFVAYVKMPQEQDFVREQTKFFAIAKFPRVIGIVDGTHIRIHPQMLLLDGQDQSMMQQYLQIQARRFEAGSLTIEIVATLTRAQQLYNDALVKTRNSIERQIGLWKRRFPVMAYGLRLHMDGIKAAIVATTVLHNIAREMNEPTPPMPDGIDLSELNYLIETENAIAQAMENANTIG
nr:unnamed protein product [Callosobruchus analis]